MLENIPGELRILPQWVCASFDKNPINPRTGQPASVIDPSTWATFEEAKRAGFLHVGFVLSRGDPYTIVDLDAPATEEQAERHRRILATFQSYTELSQSGKGVHIVIKGTVPAGVRRDKVEVYPHERYMIFTGNVINPLPITDHQSLLERIFKEMSSTVVTELEDLAPVMGDEQLYDMASQAVNGAKFVDLFAGNITGYPSQSEADFALLAILCFYSKSDSQVRRVFRMSMLGKREKAQRNDHYLDRALGKVRGAQRVPLVDLTALLSTNPVVERVEAEQFLLPLENAAWNIPIEVPLPTIATPPPAPTIILPPGLIGEMSSYIYSSAIRPVHEVSLAAAISFGAGILGRHFNISSTGLNQYTILLAETGTGKEGAAGGIDALLSAIRPQIPAADEFLGPGTFASGQALTRVLDKSPCFVSILGEVGITLQQICDKNAGAHNVQLRKVLLDVYAKSGWNKWLRPSVYSDSEKNTGLIRAPNVTILGESTPGNFYGALDSGHVAEGLVPRFLVIEYHGPRPPTNPRAFHHPDASLVAKLTAACQTVITMRANDTCCPVQTDRFAHASLEAFNTYADDKINNAGEDDVLKQLWNRAHIKALKLAALVAVGCSIHQPIVTRDIAEWAIQLVHADIENMTKKFTTGEVGQGDHAQSADVIKACERWPLLSEKQRLDYKVPVSLVDKPKLIPYAFLRRYLSQRASFKNARNGAVAAVKTVLEDMLKAGVLQQVPTLQARNELSVDSPVYFRGESW